ncbi:hypothetical protein DYU05_10950 [Mucilaginibacter terrenus]|uniref:Uncharacterized protein n=1 Tax=Mucilaginibacter terrenus TaxID=2482727 RepID=A0A3E2NP75_9SPHI|nr:hypothetical protein [Mucilaginibacter terrenus]RFZ82690.1 hypothetical protein DYU05_10950 [Mucilaginibacter terrenus]
MLKKPNLLIYDDLIEPISEAIKELHDIEIHYQNNTPPADFINKGTFAYVLALFEGAITECVERYLFAFPEKLPKIKVDFEKYKEELLGADFSYELTAFLIREYLADSSYENSGQLIEKYCLLLDIPNLAPLFNKTLREKKARRNALIHNNLKVDLKYIRTAGGDVRNKGKYMRVKPTYVLETIANTLEILEKFRAELALKYNSYTILNCVKKVWGYLFGSPIMKFDDYWNVHDDMLSINVEGIKKYYKGLSSGERTLLFYFLQNYNPGACSKIFKSSDLNMQVSNNQGMIFLVSVFDRFPLLLQSLKSIKPHTLFKYVTE